MFTLIRNFPKNWGGLVSLIIILQASLVAAQNLEALLNLSGQNLYHIQQIEIVGNERTKTFVILREMQTRSNSQVTAEMLELDRRRIQSLGLFNRVEMDLAAADSGYILRIIVTERWYLFPYPILFRNDKDWSRVSFGLGLLHSNFRGRRELLDLQGYTGYSQRLSLSYSIPWLVPKWQLYAAISLFSSKIKSQNIDIEAVDEHQQNISAALGKRFGRYFYLDGACAWTRFRTTPKEILPTLSASGIDQWLGYLVSLRYDSRDLTEFPHQGWFLSSYWRKSGQRGDAINYSFYGLDGRRYFPLPWQTVLALRSSVEISRGKIPYYRHLYLGYSERIRGHFFDEFEGENRLVGSAEFRFPLRKITYHSIFQDSPLAEYYRNLPFGISGSLFFDAGEVWYQSEGFARNKLLQGFGIGLLFHVPYVDLMRLEYALNSDMHGQVILFDLGVAF